jgi:hypothetical protein
VRTAQEASGRLAQPIIVTTFPFVTTIEVEDASARPEEPSPCLPTAAALFFELRPASRGRVMVDLAGSTPVDPLVRLYRRMGAHPAPLVFLGCASPVWNAQLALVVDVEAGDTLFAQIGTSESHEGRLVARVELLSPPD